MTWQLNKNDTREWPQAEFKHAAATAAMLFGGAKERLKAGGEGDDRG